MKKILSLVVLSILMSGCVAKLGWDDDYWWGGHHGHHKGHHKGHKHHRD